MYFGQFPIGNIQKKELPILRHVLLGIKEYFVPITWII